MTRRSLTELLLALFIGGLVLSESSAVSGQVGPGMMGGGQTASMPMPQMAEVIKQMADRLASGKPLDPDKAQQLRHLADQLVETTGRMTGGMGGGMMGQGPQQMAEVSRIIGQISDLLRSP
jgi:hypothetical protein